MLIQGTVIKGLGLATALFGVPTANVEVADMLDLKPGVYAAKALIDGDWRFAVAYMSPSCQDMVEVHIFDFSGDLLHGELTVEILDSVSQHVPWASEDQMKTKIFEDLRKAKEYFGLV